MGDIKALTANDLIRVTGVKGKQYQRVSWHTETIIMRHTLDASEFMAVVLDTVKDCKSPDGVIAPELVDFAFRVNVVSAYAAVELPEDGMTLYYIMYASDLYDTVCRYANKAQIDAVKEAVMMYVGRDTDG